MFEEATTEPALLAVLLAQRQEQQAAFRAYFFGPFRLIQQNRVVEGPIWRRNKIRSLLKWFLLHPDRPFSSDYLVELFWPDTPAEAAHRNLRVNIHYLRYLLEPCIDRGQESQYICRLANNFYLFRRDASWWCDVWEVQRLLDEAKEQERDGNSNRAAFLYRKLVSYFERGFLPEDIYEEHLIPFRSQYERLHLQMLTRLIDISMEKRELDDAAEYAYQILAIDPLHEPAIKKLLSIYRLQGNYSAASRTLHGFRHFFKAELGVEPCSLQNEEL
ncbi:DNA-binding SARP family transcriptional activator [Thermosporothrix hazakensis]|jgi:DNA-binding SARP family transcriptional activator|uniref:DNA-binding SARP family transcriptional activator n=3 Tax=Thermosporothrix TaxID=768650 RepID=A0A326U7J8_THEHA|nr:BTAD domain-containing putative transcriptional regulator [Thermosporothrix hazakensis]PZW29259.1 DNA-binding SARP family transcriptional activator [Thermosporothrix hazakensis]BBH86189.1 hypothetical protein KTC_09400 [Thermosporothrix sp. COM3]GCE45389.1 hypothetical protein KTH_02580 [Thermosporothrix hazakensis]